MSCPALVGRTLLDEELTRAGRAVSTSVSGDTTNDEMAASVMRAMADPVIAIASDTTLLWANRAAEERYGAPLASLMGQPVADLVHPDDLDTALLSMVSVLEKSVGTLVEIRLRDSSGEFASFEVRGRGWESGPEGAVVLTLREVTDRRGWEIGHGDDEMLGAVLDQLPVIAMLVDADGTLRGANRALTRTLHIDLEAVRGGPITDLVATDEVDHVARELMAATTATSPTQLEARLRRIDGSEVPVALCVVNMLDDRAVQGLLVTAYDITSLVLARRELHRRASTDDLTELPNRASLRAHLERVLSTGDPDHTILFADVDGLKRVNDRFGHRAGDTVLRAVARRLQAATRANDLVARMSGDEFVVVVATAEPETVATLVGRIKAVMGEPVALIDGRRVPVSISVGVADVVPTLTADDLLAAADAAMYIAKRERDD
jgi:diguanylate cyclase (GGDEF)-like protein/PAS domain S-box-containing protein